MVLDVPIIKTYGYFYYNYSELKIREGTGDNSKIKHERVFCRKIQILRSKISCYAIKVCFGIFNKPFQLDNSKNVQQCMPFTTGLLWNAVSCLLVHYHKTKLN